MQQTHIKFLISKYLKLSILALDNLLIGSSTDCESDVHHFTNSIFWSFIPSKLVYGSSHKSLAWCIRYIYYWNLQFQNNVIIFKTKILLPQT
jgi:hypothetical protein